MTRERWDSLCKIIKQRLEREQDTKNMKPEELRAAILKLVQYECENEYMTPVQRLDMVDSIYKSYRGLGGTLDEILQDNDITEVMINGFERIFVERNGHLERWTKSKFESEEDLRKVADRIAKIVGREVTNAKPILDARLEDGSRVNVVLNGVSLDGTVITIRKFTKDPMTMEMLIHYGSITPEIDRFLHKLVQARYNIFIAGGTGSGKTTFLNALSNYIPSDERIITIEDSAELQIYEIPNIVRMETRQATSSSEKGMEITIRDLIRSSLRMRPDRIIVGEVRGEEALDMLQAMNTGHDGSLSTGHANSAEDMISRLETMVLQGSAELPLKAVRQQIASAVDIIIHLSRLRDHSRKTMSISEVLGIDGEGNVILNPIYKFYEDEKTTLRKVSGSLIRTNSKMVNVQKLLNAGYGKSDIPAPNPEADVLEARLREALEFD